MLPCKVKALKHSFIFFQRIDYGFIVILYALNGIAKCVYTILFDANVHESENELENKHFCGSFKSLIRKRRKASTKEAFHLENFFLILRFVSHRNINKYYLPSPNFSAPDKHLFFFFILGVILG